MLQECRGIERTEESNESSSPSCFRLTGEDVVSCQGGDESTVGQGGSAWLGLETIEKVEART